MSKRGAATDNYKRSKKTEDKDVYVGSTLEMVKTMSFNKFPVLVTLTAFLAFTLLFVYSQGGHERVLRWVLGHQIKDISSSQVKIYKG